MSVGRHSLFWYLYGIYERFCITAPAQMHGLAFLITAPAHPHAAWVAVCPAVLPAVYPAVHPALFVEGAAQLFFSDTLSSITTIPSVMLRNNAEKSNNQKFELRVTQTQIS